MGGNWAEGTCQRIVPSSIIVDKGAKRYDGPGRGGQDLRAPVGSLRFIKHPGEERKAIQVLDQFEKRCGSVACVIVSSIFEKTPEGMMVWILQTHTAMTNNRKIQLVIILAIILFVMPFLYFGKDTPTDTRPESVRVTQRAEPKVSSEKPKAIPQDSIRNPPVTEDPRRVPQTPSPEPKPAPQVSIKKVPTPQVETKRPEKPFVPKTPSVVLPSEETSPVKLCAGEPITPCENCRLTHGDFALLLVDVLALLTTELYEEAFDILASLQIAPVNGWATADPEKLITLREMEEVRCSISLAFKDGSIGVGPSTVTAALNRFLEESDVSIQTAEDSGITKGDSSRSAETGYQGGEEGVLSPSL